MDVAKAMAALGVKQYCSITSAWIADMSGSGSHSGGQEQSEDADEERLNRSSEEDMELLGERGDLGDGGAFISASRPSKAKARV